MPQSAQIKQILKRFLLYSIFAVIAGFAFSTVTVASFYAGTTAIADTGTVMIDASHDHDHDDDNDDDDEKKDGKNDPTKGGSCH